MHLALSLFLLATPIIAQNEGVPQSALSQNHQETLPPVGSAAAVESQEAFREWQAKVTGTLQPHFELDYQFDFSFSSQEKEGQAYSQNSLKGGGRYAGRSLRELQHQLNFQTKTADLTQNQYAVDLLMDGSQLSAFMKATNVPEFAEGFRAIADQKVVDNVYQNYRPIFSAITEAARKEEVMPKGIDPFLDNLSGLYADFPNELGQWMHPTGFAGIGLRFMTCRRIQIKDGVVKATLTADFQEGTVLRSLAESMAIALVESGEVPAADLDSVYAMTPLFISLVDQARFVMEFDEQSEIPTGLEIDFIFDVRETAEGYEPVYHLKLSYRGVLTIPDTVEEIAFQSQPEAAESMDITSYVMLGLQYVLNIVDEQDAEDDLAF